MLRAYEVIIVEVVRSHMPFSVRFAVACMRGIGYHVAHAFSARCQVRVERRAACHGCRGAHNSSPAASRLALALAPYRTQYRIGMGRPAWGVGRVSGRTGRGDVGASGDALSGVAVLFITTTTTCTTSTRKLRVHTVLVHYSYKYRSVSRKVFTTLQYATVLVLVQRVA